MWVQVPPRLLNEKGLQMNKPYPWTCGNCAQKEVYPVIGDYTTNFKKDELILTVTLPQIEIPTCKKCGTVHTTIDIGDRVQTALGK